MQNFFGPPAHNNIMYQLQSDLNFLRESLPELSEREFLFANLMKKTDIPADDICEYLEFTPTESQIEVMEEYIYIWDRIEQVNEEIDEFLYEDDVVIFQELF